MASLHRKLIRGKPFYYLRWTKRVNGKSKVVRQVYLGSAAKVAKMLQGQGDGAPGRVGLCEFGAVTACLKIAQQLDIVGIIDRVVPRPKPKRGKPGPSVGHYALIAAINRCVEPCSKRRIGKWFGKTVLPRLLGVQASQLTSQRYWDIMALIDEQAIARIASELSDTAVKRFELDLRCLLFDATNFFTFIDSFNERPKLAQRGHSKEGRDNLRLLGLALLVSADGEVPLLHHSYAGNQNDSVTFGSLVGNIAETCRAMAADLNDVTVIFDKGNNSEENLKSTAAASLHFVGSLVPTQHPKLLAIPREKLRRLDTAQLPAVWAHRLKQKVYGTERTVLVVFNRPLYVSQVKTLRREIMKRRRKLHDLHVALQKAAKRSHSKPTLEGTRKKVAAILKGRHMKDLFSAEVTTSGEGKKARVRLRWGYKKTAFEQLKQTLLGKTILFTDQSGWTDEEIVKAYRAQAHVEFSFRAMKNPRYLAFRPQFHWTDQKLRVHALFCVIALTIATLMRRELAKAGLDLSLAEMFSLLKEIKEVTLLYCDPEGESLRTQAVLSDRDEQQQKMLTALDLAQFLAP
jgi:transposase